MKSEYKPLGRDWELWFRDECPEYREMRVQAVNEWRVMRKQYGAATAGLHWRRMRKVQRLTVSMVNTNMLYKSAPQIGGLSRLICDAD